MSAADELPAPVERPTVLLPPVATVPELTEVADVTAVLAGSEEEPDPLILAEAVDVLAVLTPLVDVAAVDVESAPVVLSLVPVVVGRTVELSPPLVLVPTSLDVTVGRVEELSGAVVGSSVVLGGLVGSSVLVGAVVLVKVVLLGPSSSLSSSSSSPPPLVAVAVGEVPGPPSSLSSSPPLVAVAVGSPVSVT